MTLPAPLRIRRASPVATAVADRGDVKSWMERLIKLVPSEIVAVYLAGRGYAAAIPGIWPLICLGLLLIVRLWGTHERGKGPQWIAVGVAAVSFVIWVFAMGGQMVGLSLSTGTASLLVLIWATLVPVFYKGD